MKRFFLLFLLYIIFCNIAFSQPQLEWLRNYPMHGRVAVMDSTGNIYVIGTIGNATKLLKYNSSGNLIWQRIDTLNTDGMGIHAAADKNGNVYFTAEDFSYRIATVKYDSSGNRNWLSYYSNAESIARANAMAIDYEGNIYITGYGRLTYRYNYVTIKYNPQGDSLWTAIYNSPPTNGGSSANAICVDLQNNVYVTGNSIISTRPAGDYLTIKYSSNGIQQWVARYEGPNHIGGDGESIIVDKYGFSYVTGATLYDINKTVIGTIKYSPNGDSVWTRFNFQPFTRLYEFGNNILLDTSLNVYVSGRGCDSILLSGYRTLKYDKFGNLLWNIFDSNYIYQPYSSILDKYYNIYSTSSAEYSIYSIEYNSSGIKIWSSHYPQFNPMNISYWGFKFFLDNFNNLYLFGGTLDSSILIKYGLPTNINANTGNIINPLNLYQNYPNPFNPVTKISFDLPKSGNVKLIVYDILGREVAALVNNEFKKAGSYTVEFNSENSASGVYFYKLITDDYIQVKKMVILK